ncbi:unnamed protein product [Mytilus edulis]|uniref:Uncharacterized protein n=1 Tax=Mytilus edulis TaxID=6550 RepID=A0A8S3TIM3_MYTED|nr:unnamed protein product [Mytilus edulis]
MCQQEVSLPFWCGVLGAGIINVEAAQQKIKLEDLQAKVSTINHAGDSSEIRKMILPFDESNKNRIRAIEKHETLTESKIIEMKTDIMKQIQDLKDTITRLNSDQNGLKDDLAEIKINLKETFGNIFEETKEVYKVTEHIHERINKLDVIVNGQYATNIVSLIKSGMSRLAKLAVNFFLYDQ